MSKYEIPFLTAAVQAFGQRFAMTRQAAFNYLHRHQGLAFLIEFYDVEHLQPMDETKTPSIKEINDRPRRRITSISKADNNQS